MPLLEAVTLPPSPVAETCGRFELLLPDEPLPDEPPPEEERSDPDDMAFAGEAAMDDAAMGRNLSGPYHTVKEALAALDEE